MNKKTFEIDNSKELQEKVSEYVSFLMKESDSFLKLNKFDVSVLMNGSIYYVINLTRNIFENESQKTIEKIFNTVKKSFNDELNYLYEEFKRNK
jgi:hypothetical protein